MQGVVQRGVENCVRPEQALRIDSLPCPFTGQKSSVKTLRCSEPDHEEPLTALFAK